MKQFFSWLTVSLSIILLPLSELDAQGLFNIKGSQINADSSEFKQGSKLFILRDNVRISTGRGLITCDYAEVNTQTFDFEARGNVVATGLEAGEEIKTDLVTGNVKTRVIDIGEYHGKTGPWYLLGDKIESKEDKTITGYNVKFTTCDLEHLGHDAHYYWKADKVVYNEDGSYDAHGIKTYVADVPIFYLPYLTSHLDGSDGQFKVVPGYSSDWGAFLLVSRKIKVTPNVTVTPMVDYRNRHGVAYGTTIDSKGPNHEFKSLFYYMSEVEVDEDEFERFNEPEERYNVDVFHRWDVMDKLTWRLNLDLVSDHEYKDEFNDAGSSYDKTFNSSLNYMDLEYLSDNYSLSLGANARLNDFESSVERLPELRYDLPSYRLNNSKFFYTNENKLGSYKAKWRNFDDDSDLEDYESSRFDSLHAIHYNAKIDNWLNFTPRAALRLTHYSDSSKGEVSDGDLSGLIGANDPYNSPKSSSNNYDDEGGSQLRLVAELGYELSFKAYKTNLDVQNEWMNVNGLRHVIEPYMNHNYIPYVSEDKEHLYYFDETDRIAEQHWVRTGVKNRLQTRRDGQVHNLVTLNTWVDFHLPSDEEDSREGVGDLGTNITFDPRSNLSFESDVILDLNENDLNIYSLTAAVGDPDKLQYTLNYLYRNEFESTNMYSNASSIYNSVYASSFSRSYTEKHALTAGLRYRLWYDNFLSFKTTYDLEEAEIVRYMVELQRRLHAWTAAVRFEESNDEYKVMVYFYLNAYSATNIGYGRGEGG
ncbi:LPS assembly protein LptD [Lentisphaera profundi]|uniref:LPS assembly protein LptD n=1 Tax=Lentisphaera profundi TaxID=1658616 RepID=A0ABY7VVJ8_9BACT|nr:LPS assembly protein LptD [Lentisphaera profundi]WDE96851.1 LPS assembly protein LptD [Lentisphaera profundi]